MPYWPFGITVTLSQLMTVLTRTFVRMEIIPGVAIKGIRPWEYRTISIAILFPGLLMMLSINLRRSETQEPPLFSPRRNLFRIKIRPSMPLFSSRKQTKATLLWTQLTCCIFSSPHFSDGAGSTCLVLQKLGINPRILCKNASQNLTIILYTPSIFYTEFKFEQLFHIVSYWN